MFEEARIRSVERQQSMPIEMEETSTLKPDEKDRLTLLGLAYASWDAYHPFPYNDTKWYSLDEFDWKVPFGWEPRNDGLRGHLFMSPDNDTALVTFKGTTLYGRAFQDSVTGSSESDKYNDNLLFSCCCANVRFANIHPPCHCSLGGNRCSNVCLTASLMTDRSYYAQATAVVDKLLEKYPSTSNWWFSGHSLGGSIASLVGQTFGFPAVTFEAVPDRLPSERLHLTMPGQMGFEASVVHVYNDADPIALGTCNGPWSLCTRSGFAFESKCRTGRNVIYKTRGAISEAEVLNDDDIPLETVNSQPTPLGAHRLAYIISVLEDETRDVPVAQAGGECEDCGRWSFGGFPGQMVRADTQKPKTWSAIWNDALELVKDFIYV